jgi:NADPH:quinone reductase
MRQSKKSTFRHGVSTFFRLMHLKALSLHIIFMLLPLLTGKGRERHGAILREIAALVDAGKLRPLMDETHFTLTNAADAYRYLLSGKATGKVVIDVTETAHTASIRQKQEAMT